MSKITINKTINASVNHVWQAYLDPEDNKRWNTAGFGWTVGETHFDPRVGGKFEAEYKSPDGKNDFMLEGTFVEIIENQKIIYEMPQNEMDKAKRVVEINFESVGNDSTSQTNFTVTFDAEDMNTLDRQKQGWNAILENFKKFVERKSNPKNQALQKSIKIKSSPHKVWKVLTNKEKYKLWTAPFTDGSYYEGEMQYLNKIYFLSPDNIGLVSEVKVCIPDFQLSFEHLGTVKDGVEDLDSVEFGSWKGARETYTLSFNDGITTLDIYQDMSAKENQFFDSKWDTALEIIKQIAQE